MFEEGTLVFDGGVGTELYDRGFYINRPFEELNLSSPADVLTLHQDYMEAGAQVITTNTFNIARTQLEKFDIAAKQENLLRAGLDIAHEATKNSDVKVGLSFGPLGVLVEPLGPTSLEACQKEYRHLAQMANKMAPFDFFILESFDHVGELEQAVEGIRSVDRDHPILASLTLLPSDSKRLAKFAQSIGMREDVNALGLNCSVGPADCLRILEKLIPLTTKPIVVQPNAGTPRQINGRYFYMTSPDYLGKHAKRFMELGASAVGGCCGTGPDHVRAVAAALKMVRNRRKKSSILEIHPQPMDRPRPTLEERPRSRLAQALKSNIKIFSIEIPPPKGASLTRFKKQIREIQDAGVNFVNVPDGARASTRVGSLHLAVAAHNDPDLKVSVIPHFTARDRNLIALQSDLLGAHVNGVSDVLFVTGDPPKLGNNKRATGVYDIDAIGLVHLADCLNRGQSPHGEHFKHPTQIAIGVACNPTATNLDLELQRWGYKVEMGADYSITQPIFDPESLFRWQDQLGDKALPLIVGIWPFVSYRNAEFMANEVPGVHVPEWALKEMESVQDDPHAAIQKGLEISQRVMASLHDRVAGFAISAPLGKVDVALELVK